MAYLGSKPQSGFITTAKQRVTSSTNNYVDLDHSISSLADVIVWVNYVKQDATNLTLTTSTRITLGATLVSADVVEIAYLGKAVATQDVSDGSLGVAKLSATGTKSSSTFLAGDNSFKTVAGTTINNNADNKVITGSGTANTLEAESGLTYNGETLTSTNGVSGASVNSSAKSFVADSNHASGNGFSILSKNDASGAIFFGDAQNNSRCIVKYNHSTELFLIDTTDASAFTMNQAGIITKPLQPAFFARKTDSGQSVGASSEVTITFNSEIFDNNADFASNTFTAPVSGRYFFSGSVRVNDIGTSDGIRQLSIKTSNNSFKNKLTDMADIVNATMPVFTHTVNVFCDMDANDTAVIAVYADVARVIDNEADVTWFCGHLVC